MPFTYVCIFAARCSPCTCSNPLVAIILFDKPVLLPNVFRAGYRKARYLNVRAAIGTDEDAATLGTPVTLRRLPLEHIDDRVGDQNPSVHCNQCPIPQAGQCADFGGS